MKCLFTFAFIFSFQGLWSQSLREALDHFENFEYSRAAEVYSSYSNTKRLPLEDYKRYAFALFETGSYEKCKPISDSLIKIDNIEPYFFFINGEVNMGLELYDPAKVSYSKYAELDDSENVSVKLVSCDSIPTWKKENYISTSSFLKNNTKANIVGKYSKDKFFFFSEEGRDSIGRIVGENDLDEASYMLSKPFVVTNEQAYLPISVVYPDSNISITSLEEIPGTNKVILTVSKPLAKDMNEMAPHLYIGEMNEGGSEIANLLPWTYSGHEDTSACAFATVNKSGDRIVFAKIGMNTLGSDLYQSHKVNDSWTKPKAISELNTDFDELFPMFIGDTTLTFSTDGRPGYGGLDIFSAQMIDGEFSMLRHMKEPINSRKDDFNFSYISKDSASFSSNRSGGYGDDDSYKILFKHTPVEVKIDSSDFFAFVNSWKDQYVYFAFNKYDLKKDVINFKELVVFLQKYPNSKLMIEGHTDNRGTVEFNDNLGFSRAQSIKYEMVNKGILPDQIVISSKGESDPQVKCTTCTEQEHAKNRVAIIRLKAY